MSKKFRRFYETAFDSKISKSDEDLLSADKQDAAIAHRLSNQLQLSASTSSVRRCDTVVRPSPSKLPYKHRLFGFLLQRRRNSGDGSNKYRSSDSMVTSSSLSLESITSDSLSSHSSESPRCYLQQRFTEPHVLSPISDKSSLDAGTEISDYERNRRSSATTQIKTKPPQSLGLIKLNRDNSLQHHGSDSGISVGSKPGDNYQELLDVPFDMPKLRRKQKSEVFHVEKSIVAAPVNPPPPVELPPFDMPKLRRKPILRHSDGPDDMALPFDMPKLRKRQMENCARVISLDFEIGSDIMIHCSSGTKNPEENVVGRTSEIELIEGLPFNIPKLKRINLQDEGGKKPDRSSLFLNVMPSNNCAAVNTNNIPLLKTFQNKSKCCFCVIYQNIILFQSRKCD